MLHIVFILSTNKNKLIYFYFIAALYSLHKYARNYCMCVNFGLRCDDDSTINTI